jgi:hypothetical protein
MPYMRLVAERALMKSSTLSIKYDKIIDLGPET